MACSNCYIDLCTVLVCDEKGTIEVPHIASAAGNYTFVLEYLNTAKVYTKTFAAGENLTIELDCLNENYCYEGYILAPDNTIVTIFTDSAYTAFKFCTKQVSLCQNN
jgi:hypothetical protein